MRKGIPIYRQLALYRQKVLKGAIKHTPTPTTTKLLSSPKMLTKFAPVSTMVRNSPRVHKRLPTTAGMNLKAASLLAKFGANTEDGKQTKPAPGPGPEPEPDPIPADEPRPPTKTLKAQHTPWLDTTQPQLLVFSPNMNTEVIRLPTSSLPGKPDPESAKDATKGTSTTSESAGDGGSNGVYCACGNLCEGQQTRCPNCLKSKDSVELSGYLYLKAKSGNMKRYWYQFLNKELYCKENSGDVCRL
jgi:hypothetical protein